MKTRKAAMPVPYIIALIIGVIVVAVLAYWFISSGGKGASVGKEAECTARKVEYCATQTSEVWNKMANICGVKKFDVRTETTKTINECFEFCKTIIPTWKPTNSEPSCQEPQKK